MVMAASSVLQAQGPTQPEFGVAKPRTRVAAHVIVVGLVGESGRRLAGRGPAPREYRVWGLMRKMMGTGGV